ncbi:hypothetical protein FNV43_RR09985 [Rhamnella rubrinervis]|uniref:Uncharacterized protein n=1 Tax=Rhamnella rubrinervis TaxID=2594499 RepID=A0A8K0MKG5_9ROSA|nr:hypothetical protein FNV43_RR09985 [Rhamnella rubrinervis]
MIKSMLNLRGLREQMKEAGYIPETQFVLNEEDKEDALIAHNTEADEAGRHYSCSRAPFVARPVLLYIFRAGAIRIKVFPGLPIKVIIREPGWQGESGFLGETVYCSNRGVCLKYSSEVIFG